MNNTSYEEAVESLSPSARAILNVLRFGPVPAAYITTLLPEVKLGVKEVTHHLRDLVAAGLVSIRLTDKNGTAADYPLYEAISKSIAKPNTLSDRPLLASLEKQFVQIQAECEALKTHCHEWQVYCQDVDNRLTRLFKSMPEAEELWAGL